MFPIYVSIETALGSRVNHVTLIARPGPARPRRPAGYSARACPIRSQLRCAAAQQVLRFCGRCVANFIRDNAKMVVFHTDTLGLVTLTCVYFLIVYADYTLVYQVIEYGKEPR